MPAGDHMWVNYGRIDPCSNEFRICKVENGVPMILYRAFWNPKRGTYKCYPHTVFVPGGHCFTPFELSMNDIKR